MKTIAVVRARHRLAHLARARWGISGFKTKFDIITMGSSEPVDATTDIQFATNQYVATHKEVQQWLESLRLLSIPSEPFMGSLLAFRKRFDTTDLQVAFQFTFPYATRDRTEYYPCAFEARSADNVLRYYYTITVCSPINHCENVTLTVNVDPGNEIYYEELIELLQSITYGKNDRNQFIMNLATALDGYTRVLDYSFKYDLDYRLGGKTSITLRKGIVGGLR